LSRITNAFSSFFGILFGSGLPEDVAKAYGYTKAPIAKPAPSAPAVKSSDGALQMLGILQRDARLIDFLMEDVGPYSDEQVGAAVRPLHEQCQTTLKRYLTLAPVIDGVEGTYTKADAAGKLAKDAAALKFIGNVPPEGRAPGGVLRHKGWRVEHVTLPDVKPSMNVTVLAPAEIEVE
jgi:hypothetical protein